MSVTMSRILRLTIGLFLFSTLFGLTWSSVGATVPYNRNWAKSYADQYTYNHNSQMAYYPDNDCTNFISQVLLYGGVPEVAGSGSHLDPDAWYYNGGIHSNSWSVAMAEPIGGYPTGGLVGHAYRYLGNRFNANTYITNHDKGDFVMFDQVPPYNMGVATHGRIGVGWENRPGLGWKYIMSQHSPVRYHVLWDYGWNPNTTSNWKITVND